MNKKRIRNAATLVIFLICVMFSYKAYAESVTLPVPKIDISLDKAKSPTEYVDNVKLLIIFTILTLLPSIVIMMTSFVRIIVVFGFLRTAIGTPQAPPNQVLTGLAIFLTIFIMTPVFSEVNTNAVQPFLQNKISQEQALKEGEKPLRKFMLKQTNEKDLKLFMEVAKLDKDKTIDKENIPMHIVVPSFMISELKTAFQIGFLLFIPFVIIDLVVASVLMSMGMFMLPPVMVSMPFKLLLFVMVDGWYLMVKSLIMSFS